MKNRNMRGKKWIPQPGKNGVGTMVLGYTMSAVAREYDVSLATIRGAIEEGTIPAPTLQHGERLYYRPEQVKQIAETLKKEKEKKINRWNVTTLAKYVGVSRCVMDWHVAKGSIPTPQRGKHRVLEWTQQQAAEIIEFFGDRRKINRDCFHLWDGLLSVGLSENEIVWAKSHDFVPEPDYVIGKASRRNKFYTEKTLQRAARAIKVARIMKGIE